MSSPDEFSDVLAMFRDSHASELEQADFEIEFFGRILARNSSNVEVIRRLVEHRSRRGDYRAALPLYRKLVDLRPNDCIARYNLACTLSMQGKLDEAMTALEVAFQLGYSDIAHLETDTDMEPLRDHSGYARLIEKYDSLLF